MFQVCLLAVLEMNIPEIFENGGMQGKGLSQGQGWHPEAR